MHSLPVSGVRLIEVHNGISAIIAEQAVYHQKQFDGMWISSLTESCSRGIPDQEIIGFETRLQLVDEVKFLSNRPLVIDVDTGGTPAQLQYRTRKMDLAGAAAIVMEDKLFPKRNSFAGGAQELEDQQVYCDKISLATGVARDCQVIARTESLILGLGIEESIKRATAYADAGADGVLIHSKATDGMEILEFTKAFKDIRPEVSLWCVPTTYNSICDSLLFEAGLSVVIHANHMMRAAIEAMRNAAESILTADRSLEISKDISSIQDIFRLTRDGSYSQSTRSQKI